jgi:dephospho-CoA kinase
LTEIQRVFGACMLEETGALRRAALARLVFEDADARKRLETILHPRIRERWLAAAAEWRKRGEALGVVIIPLLFETDAARHFDATVCVACTAASQSQRLAARGWTPEQSARRMQAQWPVEWKIDRADYVIWTEGELHVTAEQARRVQCSAG